MKNSIEQIRILNNRYNKTKKELDELYEELKEFNTNIDMDEFMFLSYEDMKEIFDLVKYNIDGGIGQVLSDKLNYKRLEKYTQLKDAHYYPELLKLDYLTKEQRLALDENLMNLSNYGNINARQLFKYKNYSYLCNDDLYSKIIDFLIYNKILEKRYIFRCRCNSDDCFDEVIDQEYKDKFYKYYNLCNDYKNLTENQKDELDKLAEYGFAWFEVGCFNGGDYEVGSIEDFEKNLWRIDYKIIKKPDLSLENV